MSSLSIALACGPKENGQSSAAPSGSPGGAALSYSFGTLDGGILGSGAHRGRVTIILFGTTYDLATQAEARRLDSFLHEHSPRINALLVMLEPPMNVEVVRAYGEILNLSYPLVMADRETLSHRGTFGKISSIPAWVFLDRHGVIRGVAEGTLDLDQLRKMTAEVEDQR